MPCVRLSDSCFEVAPDDAGPGCGGLRNVLTGTGSSGDRGMYLSTAKHFDGDSDGKVTRVEFDAAINEYTCCGGNQPFSCFCRNEAFRAFPPLPSRLYAIALT